jgi:AcrR family transcriptional regulator
VHAPLAHRKVKVLAQLGRSPRAKALTGLTNASIGEHVAAKVLSREEAKTITRRRLIEAGLKLMSQSGGRQLTASAIAREAGVAQPTFYVHFRDLEDLLRSVAEIQIEELRTAFHAARSRIDLAGLARGDEVEAVRDAFRVPLQAILDRPVQFRVYVQERIHADSPLGRHCRKIAEELRRDLIADLGNVDRYTGRERSAVELAMIADGLTALTEAVGLGLLERRYEDVDRAVDVLVGFARGTLT